MWIYLLVDMISEQLVFLAISLAHCKYWVNHNQSSNNRKRSSKNQKRQPICNSFTILLSIKKFWDCHDEVSSRTTYSFWLLQTNQPLLSLKISPWPPSQQLNRRTRYFFKIECLGTGRSRSCLRLSCSLGERSQWPWLIQALCAAGIQRLTKAALTDMGWIE